LLAARVFLTIAPQAGAPTVVPITACRSGLPAARVFLTNRAEGRRVYPALNRVLLQVNFPAR
ncbi:MAG: hypothetical protein WBN51_05340, partial [Gammaproteobacteria bacterium]